MMILLTDEEYRALQFKQCEKCETIRQELQAKLEKSSCELVQEILGSVPLVTIGLDAEGGVTKLRTALDKFSKSLEEHR